MSGLKVIGDEKGSYHYCNHHYKYCNNGILNGIELQFILQLDDKREGLFFSVIAWSAFVHFFKTLAKIGMIVKSGTVTNF